MEWTRAHARTTWTTKNRRYGGAPAVTTLRSVISKQIEAGGNKVDELKLCNRAHSHQRGATCCSNNRAFGNWSVDHTFFAKLVDQAVSDFERAAVCADVFADDKDCRVAFHLFPDALANCFDHRCLSATFRTRRFVFFFESCGHFRYSG